MELLYYIVINAVFFGVAFIYIRRTLKGEIKKTVAGIEARLESTFEDFSGLFNFEEILEKPTVKRAMSILGTMSGKSRGESSTVADITGMVLNSPKMGALKLAAGAIGVDVDSLIEQHGPENTLSGLMQLGGMLGINVNDILKGEGGIGDIFKAGQGNDVSNPYLKGR